MQWSKEGTTWPERAEGVLPGVAVAAALAAAVDEALVAAAAAVPTKGAVLVAGFLAVIPGPAAPV